MKWFVPLVLIWIVQPLVAADRARDRDLIVACFQLDVRGVVTALRQGASVHVRACEVFEDDYRPFVNPFYGILSNVNVPSWTPLLAVAASSEFPKPPDMVQFKTDEEIHQWKQAVPKDEIQKRRQDALTILLILLSHGADVNAADNHGATALYYAVYDEKIAMARALLEFGAKTNVRVQAYIDGPGDTTPLHYAVYSQELTQLLLDFGADPTAKDSDGRTPVDWLASKYDRTFDLVQTPKGWEIRPRGSQDQMPKGDK